MCECSFPTFPQHFPLLLPSMRQTWAAIASAPVKLNFLCVLTVFDAHFVMFFFSTSLSLFKVGVKRVKGRGLYCTAGKEMQISAARSHQAKLLSPLCLSLDLEPFAAIVWQFFNNFPTDCSVCPAPASSLLSVSRLPRAVLLLCSLHLSHAFAKSMQHFFALYIV